MDIGANIGCYTLIAVKTVGSNGAVYSFEPDPEVHQRLKTNVELNGFQNTVTEKKAVSEKSDTLKIYVSSGENTGMSGIYRHDTENGRIEHVEAIALDD